MKAPCPHLFDINKTFSPSDPDPPEPSMLPSSKTAMSEPAHAMPSKPSAPAIPNAFVHPMTPLAPCMNLREVYVPPSQTTTCTGHISCPAVHLDTYS